MTAAADKRVRRQVGTAPSDPKPHIYVMSATKTATPALVCSATSDAATAQQDINKINK